MSYDPTKATSLAQLKAYITRNKTDLDAVSGRVTALEGVGAQANVLEGVKVNGTALEIANKFVNLLVATGSVNGTVSIAGADVAVKGLAALAYKSEVSEDDLATALKALIDGKAAQTDLNALSGKVTTLIGSDADKSSRAIAAEEVAKVVADAPEDFDTLKEIAEWIKSDKTGAAKMQADISALQTKVTLGTDGDGKEYATVKAYVEAVIAGLSLGDYAKTADVNAGLANKVDKVEGKGLSTEDYTTAEKQKLAGLNMATDAEFNEMLAEVYSE